VRLSPEARRGGFAYFGRLADLKEQLEQLLGGSVDLVVEPVQKEALRQAVQREAALAF
jgi:predicted nucleotidyltransferase